ncbi:MAG: ABC transporter permease [Chitinophagales bacterium]|nr:ABC transporter permease [Chitinophagales bacterium]
MSKIVISAEPDDLKTYLQKIWNHKSLIITLAKRDLKVKYAQTVLGLAWTVVQPITSVIVYTLFFSVLLNFETPYPYVLFVLSGVLLWGLFNYIFSQGSTSLMQNQDLIRKMYFPKMILPFSKVLVAFVEFGVIFIIFLLMLLIFSVPISWKIILIPIPIFILTLFSIGTALILSAATIKNRDLNHIIPFLIYFGIWLTPVFYPVTVIPQQYADWLYINPMAAVIQLFRWCVFDEPINKFILIGIALSFIIFGVGFFYFKKVEDKIIDLL